MIASKIGRRKTILIGITLMLISFISAAFFTEWSPVLIVLFALTGIGWASINVNSYPMVVEMSRGANIGRYTGYYYTFSMAAQVLTPILSGFLLAVLRAVEATLRRAIHRRRQAETVGKEAEA